MRCAGHATGIFFGIWPGGLLTLQGLASPDQGDPCKAAVSRSRRRLQSCSQFGCIGRYAWARPPASSFFLGRRDLETLVETHETHLSRRRASLPGSRVGWVGLSHNHRLGIGFAYGVHVWPNRPSRRPFGFSGFSGIVVRFSSASAGGTNGSTAGLLRLVRGLLRRLGGESLANTGACASSTCSRDAHNALPPE